MAYETIIVEVEDHIATIKLNRPDALNALNSHLLKELVKALKEADGNEKVRCIILTGSAKHLRRERISRKCRRNPMSTCSCPITSEMNMSR